MHRKPSSRSPISLSTRQNVVGAIVVCSSAWMMPECEAHSNRSRHLQQELLGFGLLLSAGRKCWFCATQGQALSD
jgi:hypothetical protein